MTPKTAFDSSSSAIPRQQGQTLESLSQGQIQHEVLLKLQELDILIALLNLIKFLKLCKQ